MKRALGFITIAIVIAGLIAGFVFINKGKTRKEEIETSIPIETTEGDINIKISPTETSQMPIALIIGEDGEVYTEESIEMETQSLSEAMETINDGDAFVKLDLPTLSTGKTFDEMESMQYEIVYSQWEQTSDEDRGYMGREGLKANVQMIEGLSEQEVDEIADYILSKLPLPVQEASKQESKSASQPTQNQTQSKPKETQASVQTQPTQSQQSGVDFSAEDLAEIERINAELEREAAEFKEKNGGEYGHEAGEGYASDDLKDADININGF